MKQVIKKIYGISLFACITTFLAAQSAGYVIGYTGKSFEEVVNNFPNESNRNAIHWTPIGPYTQTYKVTIPTYVEPEFLAYLSKQTEVVGWDKDVRTQYRLRPNDPRLVEQYYLELIDVYRAWDITTGGTDFNGNDIVIAVIDDGFDISHEDLKGNIYINVNETPSDNIDNDNNGYIDDVYGWNTENNSGMHKIHSHGTNVIGVLGAEGNNATGISGINWKIKILPITTGATVSDVIKGYEYILAQKSLYVQSGGSKGINIVVSSYSGGVEGVFASDFPIWCDVYRKLGLQGVLNVSATTNSDINVDEEGDMPSTCPSDYLLVVSATDMLDEKDRITGYGSTHVDISAPGDKIMTTGINAQKYTAVSGTSLSTPIVASAAGLLHSLSCENFYNYYKDDPSGGTLAIKNAIMTSVDKKQSLVGKTVSEGRLNIYGAILSLREAFDECIDIPSEKGALAINNAYAVDDVISLDFISPNENKMTIHLHDLVGKTLATQSHLPAKFGMKKATIKTPPLAAGLYILSIIQDDEIASRVLFIP